MKEITLPAVFALVSGGDMEQFCQDCIDRQHKTLNGSRADVKIISENHFHLLTKFKLYGIIWVCITMPNKY